MFEKSKLIMRFFGIYEIFLRFLRCFEISFDYMEVMKVKIFYEDLFWDLWDYL